MPKLNVYKSTGDTIYLCGLRVFRGKGADKRIRLTYDKGDKKGLKKNICYCPKGSDIDKFFDGILKQAGKF